MLRVNAKKSRIMKSENNAGKIIEEGKFSYAFCGSNSILSQFCSCWVHKRRSSIGGKVKEDITSECQTCVNQQTDLAEDSPGVESNGQSLEIVNRFDVLMAPVGARGSAVDRVITKIKSRWSKFRDLVLY